MYLPSTAWGIFNTIKFKQIINLYLAYTESVKRKVLSISHYDRREALPSIPMRNIWCLKTPHAEGWVAYIKAISKGVRGRETRLVTF